MQENDRSPTLADSTNTVDDLGFTYLQTKAGIVFIRHHGKLASELRGTAAEAFIKRIAGATFKAEQQLMARLTGNYKRGNERVAKKSDRRKE